MNILPNIQIIDLALYFDSVLVISDVHIGYEEALNKQGILVPRLQFNDIINKMEKIFESLENEKIEKIIVNGDLKHEFGAISQQEWRNTLKFIDLLSGHCSEIILVKGNHDAILGPIADKRNIKILECAALKDILVCHGDKIPAVQALKNISTVIIGHEHPSVPIRDSARVENFKCFLKGRYKGRNLIVQPSFNTIVQGTNILRGQTLSPLLKQNLDNFEVFVIEDKVYQFGKLKTLRKNFA